MVYLADSGFWLALIIPRHPFHAAARAWFEQLRPSDRVIFCRATQQSFLRLLTTAAVMKAYDAQLQTNAGAWTMYAELLANTQILFAAEPANLESVWQKFASRKLSAPKLWMDAYLAAFAIAGGHSFVTTDKGFTQFRGLNVQVLTEITDSES